MPTALTSDHFESWEKLEEALLWLPTDEQCSDAIYGDWLLQLNNPGGTERLAIKSLLIGNGALAANYLAELAQNANDAADMKEAEIRVVLEGNWLVFANNGRKVTPLNQIGLCRFFRHFDPGLPLLSLVDEYDQRKGDIRAIELSNIRGSGPFEIPFRHMVTSGPHSRRTKREPGCV